MRKTRLLACLIAGALAVSLTACGSSSSSSKPEQTKAETQAGTQDETKDKPEETTADDPGKDPVEASIDFEDGKFAFAAAYMVPADCSEIELSVADFNGSKALQITNNGGKTPYVGIDVASLLGAKAADVAKIQMDMGIKYPDGEFSAVQGRIVTWTGADIVETEYAWSVYLETKNPARVTTDISAVPFVADSKNIMVVSLNPGQSADAKKCVTATVYIDNIAFYDAEGKLIEADSAAEFVAPDGFEKKARDPKLWTLANPVTLEDFAVSNAAWSQSGRELTDEEKALFVPGTVIEVAYKCDSPVWLVCVGAEPFTKYSGSNASWQRVGVVDPDKDFATTGNVDEAGTIVQFTYEQIVEQLGDDWLNKLGQLQLEGQADWEIYSVSIGKKSDYASLTDVTELADFAVSNAAWNQAGRDLTDEDKALLVPGSVIEVSFKCSAPVWIVAKSSTGNFSKPAGNWIRIVDEANDFTPVGSVDADGATIQFTYEQLVDKLGEDFLDYLTGIDCEGREDWEVYSVSIGKKAE